MKKRILSLCMAVALLFALLPDITLSAVAAEVVASGTCGNNLTWTLDDEGTLSIAGTGEMFNYNEENKAPWSNYFFTDNRELITIKNVVVSNGATTIGSSAFSSCYDLTYIILPEGITSIGEKAFYSCIKLINVTLPQSVAIIGDKSFWSCDSITSITIPGSVSCIGESSFWYCKELQNVVISEGVISIGDSAFGMCNKLHEVTLPSSISHIGSGAFYDCNELSYIGVDSSNPNYCNDVFGVLYNKNKTILIQAPGKLEGSYSIPLGVTSIAESAFYGCSKLDNISIPDSVHEIGEYAFFECSSLSEVIIPENVTAIPMDAFTRCTNLLDVTIPNGVISIGEGAFDLCENLTHVYIPSSVEEIGATPFSYCYKLSEIAVDPNNQNYSSDSYGILYNKEKTILLQIPGGISGSCNIPNGVIEIVDWAAESCDNLTNVYLPNSVVRIGDSAFRHCDNLNNIIISKKIESIGEYAFCACFSLKTIVFTGNQPTLGSECFHSVVGTVYYSTDDNSWVNSSMQDYGGIITWLAVNMPNYGGFWLNKDGWTFANAAESFAEEPISHSNDYYIPRERYDEVFGSAYVDATDGLYTEDWGGNCAGMSATSILFFLDKLDWESIDEVYTEDFANPNDFYHTVNLDQKSQSYYSAIGNDTEVTRLIEAYQLYINAIDKSRLTDNLDNTYFAADATEKKTLFGTEYIINHVPNGTYIASTLEEFQEAYEENNPLFIVLQADGFGHGIVARTDLKPEDMGDGWWRVYVYDPNKPYINESVTSTVSGVEVEPKFTFGCNTLIDNGGDIYLELNPSLNQWRYCTSVNSNSSDSYIGSSPSGELLWKNYYHDATPENENDDEGKKNNAKMPDFFYTIDLTDLSMEDFANPHFSSTNSWIPENDLAVAVDGDTDCSIYTSTGELVAIVENGDAFVLTDSGSYDAYIGQTEDGGSTGGRIYLPNDVYTVYYTSGIIQFLGNDNALSFSFEGAAELTVDIALNSLQILAQEDGIAAVKCANVISTDECSYVDTEGSLVAGETFTIAYSDENKVEASTDSKDGEFQLYQKDAGQDEPVATKVIKSGSLLWLWIVGGVAVAGVVLFILLKKKKPNT